MFISYNNTIKMVYHREIFFNAIDKAQQENKAIFTSNI